MILVFGSINIDLVARVASIPRPGETVLARRYETLFGGKGANQAVAAARVSARGTVAMAGRVGDDAFGASCIANLKANGVGTSGIECDRALPTGCAFIAVDGRGENAITVASGANMALDGQAMQDLAIDENTVAVFQMEVPAAASLAAAARVKATGGRVIWNLAPAPADLGAGDLRAIMAASDVLVVNEIEAEMAARAIGEAGEDTADHAKALARAGGLSCVLTAGSQGAYAFDAESGEWHAPALSITPIDTTGAGDTFVGIFAAELHAGAAIPASLRKASVGASLACLKAGAQAGMPDRAALDEACAGIA